MSIERVGVFGCGSQVLHFAWIIAHVDERFSEIAFTVHTILEIDTAKHSARVILRYDVVAPMINVL